MSLPAIRCQVQVAPHLSGKLMLGVANQLGRYIVLRLRVDQGLRCAQTLTYSCFCMSTRSHMSLQVKLVQLEVRVCPANAAGDETYDKREAFCNPWGALSSTVRNSQGKKLKH